MFWRRLEDVPIVAIDIVIIVAMIFVLVDQDFFVFDRLGPPCTELREHIVSENNETLSIKTQKYWNLNYFEIITFTFTFKRL